MNKNIFMFDVESDGLYGDAIAIGALVFNYKGEILSMYDGRVDLDSVTNEFVKKEVVPNIEPMRVVDSKLKLRTEFWNFYMNHKNSCDIWSDVNYPVETNFFAQCIRDNLKEREFEGPYPLLDVATVFSAKGFNPDIDRVEFLYKYCNRIPSSNVKHDPLCDAKVSALCLIELLNGGYKRKKEITSVEEYVNRK